MGACLRRIGSATDDRKPPRQRYHLTTFGGPGDEQPTQCEDSPDADGSWYYAANRQRFACGQRVRLVDRARRRCVIVQVADLGPNICVEEAAQRPAWDVSPLAAKHLFGVSEVGWSEDREVLGAPVSGANPLGPCDDHLEVPGEASRSFVGGACSGDDRCEPEGSACLSEEQGWPNGHCSLPCSGTCPDAAGPWAATQCVAMSDGIGRCLARCDFTLFETGCRPGYGCRVALTHPFGESEPVCVPSRCP